MATTKVRGEVVDFNPGNPDYILDSTNAVTVINAGGNQYNFNGVYGKFGAKIGTITLTGVPAGHPIAFINNGKTSQISYTGTVDEGTATGPDGNTYTFYSGTVTLTVSADFGTISYYCKIHGYMGGQDNLVYTYSESGLKIPTGTNNNRPATDVAGMIRNNTNETSESSASCEEYYNGSTWQKLNNTPPPAGPRSFFNIVTWSGNGANRAITGVGFQPDAVWIKNRSTTADLHMFDSTRGATKFVSPQSAAAEQTASNTLTSFDSDGFSLGVSSAVNDNGNDYVAWCWKANGGTTSSNTDGGITTTLQVNSPNTYFSIIRYNGNYTQGTTLGHGIGTAPGVGWIGRTSHSENRRSFWQISGTGGTPYQVTTDSPSGSTPTQPNSFFPSNATASVVNYGNDPSINYTSAYQYIFYLFASVTNFTNFGTYSGNGSTQAITTGFAPKLIWIQRQDAAGNWQMYDSVRGNTKILMMNNDQAEITDTRLTFDSTGFTLNATAVSNGSGSTFWYCAWA
jgi:hypothetical protein|tara:strand:- start:207 stop:1742 length:1536 start_codon:yes stop_codon:yes gene_type:complete